MADLTNFKKLSQEEQFKSVVSFIKSFPEAEQDAIAEDCLGMTLAEAERVMAL